MCELFAISALYEASVNISLHEFARHGGLTAPHKDGWGIAYYEGLDLRLIREPASASESTYLQFLNQLELKSDFVLAHIRRATQGDVCLRNTQPLVRSSYGRKHTFIHNGDLIDISGIHPLVDESFLPIGETDSEYAFCLLMGRYATMMKEYKGDPPLDARFAVVLQFACDIRVLGTANFIFCDGDFMFAHSHKRTQVLNQPPRPPGLHYLQRHCQSPHALKTQGLSIHSPKEQKVTLFASVPLTQEAWSPMPDGQVVAVSNGQILRAHQVADDRA